ncbi:MAG TPA: hypothetical protein DC046_01485 [Rhodospirillaceae bacterium]|nr:hypothetical protein [Rhodospirillaceae bacterium]
MSASDVLSTELRNYALSRGFRFGDGADQYLRNMTEQALERGAEHDEVLNALKVFVDQMIVASRQIRGYADNHPGVIGEETFGIAHSLLCPLPPIC